MKPWQKETLHMAVGQAVCLPAMYVVFALLGKFGSHVFLGGLLGSGIALVNFALMVAFVDLAARQAERQNVAVGRKWLQLSYLLRTLGTFAALILCAAGGQTHPLALVLPLTFTRPILAVSQWIRQKGVHTDGTEC